jgi:hypothetical protein
LWVSPTPTSGAFFYHGDSAMLRYMQRATEAALGVGGVLKNTKHRNPTWGGH